MRSFSQILLGIGLSRAAAAPLASPGEGRPCRPGDPECPYKPSGPYDHESPSWLHDPSSPVPAAHPFPSASATPSVALTAPARALQERGFGPGGFSAGPILRTILKSGAEALIMNGIKWMAQGTWNRIDELVRSARDHGPHDGAPRCDPTHMAALVGCINDLGEYEFIEGWHTDGLYIPRFPANAPDDGAVWETTAVLHPTRHAWIIFPTLGDPEGNGVLGIQYKGSPQPCWKPEANRTVGCLNKDGWMEREVVVPPHPAPRCGVDGGNRVDGCVDEENRLETLIPAPRCTEPGASRVTGCVNENGDLEMLVQGQRPNPDVKVGRDVGIARRGALQKPPRCREMGGNRKDGCLNKDGDLETIITAPKCTEPEADRVKGCLNEEGHLERLIQGHLMEEKAMVVMWHHMDPDDDEDE